MAANLEAPVLILQSPAIYPESLRGSDVAGSVELELVIDENGEVSQATVQNGSHPLLNECSLLAATRLKFRPALANAKPVPVRISFSYRFEASPRAVEAPPVMAALHGMVRSRGNRLPVAGAALREGTLVIAVSDEEGRFRASLSVGTHLLDVSAPGYRRKRFSETLHPGEDLEVIYRLDAEDWDLYTVVRGERERTEVSRITLHERELRDVPGTMGDPFRVVMLLPGVASILSGISYPVVRGTHPAATGYFVDGIRVPVLFHLFLGPAVVHPDLLGTIDFFGGTPPARYGRLMGGVVDGRISKSGDDRFHLSAYADLINAGLFSEYFFPKTGTNLSLAGRFSYTPWLIALVSNVTNSSNDNKLVLNFYDYQARMEQRIQSGRLRLLAIGSSDEFGTSGQGSGNSVQSILFHRLDLRYQQPIAAGELEIGATAGWDTVSTQGIDSGGHPVAFHASENNYSVRGSWSSKLGRTLQLTLGGDLIHKIADVSSDGSFNVNGERISGTHREPRAIGTFSGAFGELTWNPFPRWKFTPGVRTDSYHLNQGVQLWVVEPRLSIRYAPTDELTLKAGAGLYHQPPTTLINLPVVDLAALSVGLQEGIQVSTGAEWKLFRQFDFNAEVYFNRLRRTIEFDPFDPDLAQTPLGSGSGPLAGFAELAARSVSDGYAYGLELLLRHPLGGRWFGWISYTLQHSVRKTTFRRYNLYDEPISPRIRAYLPFIFDQTHIFNAVVSYRFRNNWTVGGAIHFNTGRPETGSLTSQTMREGFSRATGQPEWVRGDKDQADRLPSFFRVDTRISKEWIFDNFELEAYLDVLNLTFTGETLGYDYLHQTTPPYGLVKRPQSVPVVIPMLGLKGTY